MSTSNTSLGAIAGSTIFLGLPLGRIAQDRAPAQGGAQALAAGILLFLFIEVLAHGVARSRRRWRSASDGATWAGSPGSRSVRRRHHRRADEPRLLRPLDGAPAQRAPISGPGAAAAAEFEPDRGSGALAAGRWLGAADRDRHRRAQLRRGAGDRPVGGDGRDRARARARSSASACTTRPKGFGIVGPMAGDGERPRWGFLGPARPDRRRRRPSSGRSIGQAWVNEAIEVALPRGRRRARSSTSIMELCKSTAKLRAQGARRRGCCCSGCSSASPRSSCSKPRARRSRPAIGWRRDRLRLGLSARDDAGARPSVHVRGRRTASARAPWSRSAFGGRARRGVVVEVDVDAPPRRRRAAVDGVVERAAAARSSTSRSGSPTTTARHPARALALVAPPQRERRKEQPPPAERESLGGRGGARAR